MLSTASKALVIYTILMVVAVAITFVISLRDTRTVRDVGVWIKPMKFMGAIALFSLTTVWLAVVASAEVESSNAFVGISVLIILTSLFEVGYITYRAYHGEASHYNTSTPLASMLYSLMGLMAVCLVASQAWLAWEIWRTEPNAVSDPVKLSIIIGLVLTFILSTVGGLMLGGRQPPSGQGIPFFGWHFSGDLRPSHFLGLHAQQFIPILGLLCYKFLGSFATPWLLASSTGYVVLWVWLVGVGLR